MSLGRLFGVQGFRVLGASLWGLGFSVFSLGFRVEGLGLRVEGVLRFRASLRECLSSYHTGEMW